MLSGTLKDRLAQYKTLKEEEERKAASAAGTSPPDPPNTNAAPDESWVPKGQDTDIEIVEEYVEEIIEDSESYEDVSVQEADGDKSQNKADRDQDVFLALDEAERAEESKMPKQTQGKNESSSGKQTCIILLLLFVTCGAIVAILLPFFIEYPQLLQSTTNGAPQPPGTPLQTVVPTVSPTMTPTTLRWGQFMKTFLIPISGEEVFQNEASPQYRAAKFVLDDPYTDELTTSEQLEERYASAVFYFSTNGGDWDSCSLNDNECKSGRWLVGDVCGWYAVTCNGYGMVTSFDFADADGNGLVGSLPAEMYLFSELTDLIIVNNTITGTLPEAFGMNATSMRSLLLPDNELKGSIPENYLSNSPLEFVHLGGNSFSGPVPKNIGDASYLQQLDLSSNAITGFLPENYSRYTALEALSFAHNELKGTIPEDIYGMANLKFLHLNGNELDGTISTSVGDLSSLKELRVGQSNLSGNIPDELYFLTNLVELDISGAQFDGRLSLGLLNLGNLEKLIVNNNNLVGTVPNSFGRIKTLTDVSLQGNNLSGSVPESVCWLREENLEVLTADCEELICNCCSACF